METKYIPRYIGATFQALWWEMDEMFILIGGIAIGILFGFLMISIIISSVLLHYYAKYKENSVKGFYNHVMYWYGFINEKKIFKSHIKKIIR